FSGNINLNCEVEANCYNIIDNLQNKRILEDELFTDCVIKIDDKIIKAHRCILAKNSEVFLKMFEQNGMIEAQKNEVIISDSSPECFQIMVEFFYTGEVSKSLLETHFEDLFAIAHKYQVDALKYECELFMSSKIGKTACGIYIQVHRKIILNSKVWEEIERTYPQLSIRFLKFIIAETDKINI
ncbi:hypothetical protein Mgra_00008123, partial [Meloidogyne graminicola]